MNKLSKRIYILIIVITGIIALSVYSTYAIFTYESETSDIVSIHTPSGLNVITDTYEYKRITVPKYSYITTDIDIYNNFNTSVCYSIWYKPISKENIDINKIKVYENNSYLDTTGTADKITSKRISIIITNDNEYDVSMNIGLSHVINNETCELNISADKLSVTSYVDNPKILTSIINKEESKDSEAGYIIYKNNTTIVNLANEEEIYLASKFTYNDELFTLLEADKIKKEDLKDYLIENTDNIYTCLDKDTCNKLLSITKLDESNNISEYDKYIGYLKGPSGIRKITNNNITNYVYYGDNPDNYIYYNCLNESDKNTCELWRIIGTFYNEESKKYLTKIIKNDSIGTYKYDEAKNVYEDTLLNKYLNETYKINKNYLKSITFHQENILDLSKQINYLDKEIKTTVTIMNLSDYLNASVCIDKSINEYDNECLNNNWLNPQNELSEWTNSIKFENPIVTEEETINPLNNTVYSVANEIKESNIKEELNIRPVIYLTENTFIISGNGTFDNPYMIK